MQDEAYASVDGGARRQAICARRKRHSRDGSSPAAKCAESLHEQEEANQQRNRWHGKDPRGRLPRIRKASDLANHFRPQEHDQRQSRRRIENRDEGCGQPDCGLHGPFQRTDFGHLAFRKIRRL